MNAKTVVAALFAVLLLAACGNKGPLVLPPKPVPADQGAPAPAPAGDVDDEAEAEDDDG